MPTVQLVRVATVDDVRGAVGAFNDESFDPELGRALLRETTYWVEDPESGDFGPSKFCGFQSLNAKSYQQARDGEFEGAAFDGGVARTAIEAVFKPKP